MLRKNTIEVLSKIKDYANNLTKDIFRVGIRFYKIKIIVEPEEIVEFNWKGKKLNEFFARRNDLIHMFIDIKKLNINLQKIPENEINYLQNLAYEDYIQKGESELRTKENELLALLQKYSY